MDREPARRFEDLIVWQKAMDLVVEVYRTTATFPREELYGLSSQLRRAANAVPSKIAEGQGRQTTAEFLRLLSIAYGSLMELETQILIGERLGYIDSERSSRLLEHSAEVGRLMNGLMRSLHHLD